MKKTKSLFDKEIKKDSFRKHYWEEREAFKLELQFLKALEDNDLTYEQFAEMIGSSKGNISRDLKVKGLNRATIHRIEKMASAINMEFFPLLLPKDPEKREKAITEILRAAV
jgi:transcriptional regulator with XRE-family HTH domain